MRKNYLVPVIFILLSVFAIVQYADASQSKPVITSGDYIFVSSKGAPVPGGVYLHPSFKWTSPIKAKSKYEGKISNYVTTNIVRGIRPYKAYETIEKQMKASGWTTSGPAGGGSSLGAEFKKGGRKVYFQIAQATEDGIIPPDEPYTGKKPVGTIIEITY